MHAIGSLLGLWYLWTLYSDDRDAREQTRRESEQEHLELERERLELERERLELERERAAEEEDWRLEQRHELEQLRHERELERAEALSFDEQRALVESWKRTNERQARECEAHFSRRASHGAVTRFKDPFEIGAADLA